MPRYIDADELLNRLPNNLPYKGSVKRVLMQAPEADVVPKSEVERLEKELANMLVSEFTDVSVSMERLYRIRTEHPIYKAIKDEVAREIFEEIEGLIVEYGNGHIFMVEKFAELKKKYLGEN